MKLPSVFRTPRHQKFHIAPRYYDPIKDEIEERTSRIKGHLDLDEQQRTHEYQSRISGAFTKRNARGADNTGLRQFAIIIVLILTTLGYLEYGNKVFYGLMLLFPVYFYLRFKKAI